MGDAPGLFAVDDDSAQVNAPLGLGEAAELEGLRAEVTRLRAELAAESSRHREAEEACRAQDVAVGQLVHDLRSPLSAITTWAEMFTSENLDEESRREGVRIIEASAAAQAELLSSWSRCRAG